MIISIECAVLQSSISYAARSCGLEYTRLPQQCMFIVAAGFLIRMPQLEPLHVVLI
jgi:hypothetical protein